MSSTSKFYFISIKAHVEKIPYAEIFSGYSSTKILMPVLEMLCVCICVVRGVSTKLLALRAGIQPPIVPGMNLHKRDSSTTTHHLILRKELHHPKIEKIEKFYIKFYLFLVYDCTNQSDFRSSDKKKMQCLHKHWILQKFSIFKHFLPIVGSKLILRDRVIPPTTH